MPLIFMGASFGLGLYLALRRGQKEWMCAISPSDSSEPSVSPRVLTILPPRESYAAGSAGAIALLVSRLALPSDAVAGAPIGDPPLPGGMFVPLHPPRLPLPRNLRYALACLREVRRAKPDLVEIHNKPDLAAFLARFSPKGVSVRLVLHNDPRSMRGARTQAARDRLASRVLVCAVSRWVAERFGSRRVEIQPNCIDLAVLPKPRERGRTVLFAGRVVADKGADAFVAAWGRVRARFPGWRAVMIGADRFGADSPDTPFLRALLPEAAREGVELRGYLPHGAVLDAMAEAAIVAVPSRWPEPFGMTALEGMACGAAVIASPMGALPEVVGDAALLAAPEDLEAALARLMEDAALREELGRKGRERAALFGLEQARRRLLALRALALR